MIHKFSLLSRAACFFTLFGCFFGLGILPLMDNNEGLYAAIARSMTEGGSLIIPHLNGMPYIEKPPLLYWLTALSFKIFGFREWAARLVPSLALFSTIAATVIFLRRVQNKEIAALAAIIMSSSAVLLAIARLLFFDMLFTMFITFALIAAYNWYDTHKRAFLRIAYAMMALAVMTKGIAAIVIIAGTGLCFFIVERTPRTTWLKIFDPFGIGIFFLIVVPWHLAASFEEPGFAWFYFINEHVLRFLNKRMPHDYYTGPWWYYLPRIMLYLFPWSFLVFALRKPRSRFENFLFSWFLWTLAFFSLSTAKANYYMIVGVPPLVMLLAIELKKWMGERRWRFNAVIAAASIVLFALPGAIFYIKSDEDMFSQFPIARYLETHNSGQPVGTYRDFEEFSALSFYLDKQLTVVDSESNDLYYGLQNHAAEGSFNDLTQWIKPSRTSVLVVRNKYLPNLLRHIDESPLKVGLKMDIEPFSLVSVVTLKRD